jgi:transcriptional regulator with XRE-family HTH domain
MPKSPKYDLFQKALINARLENSLTQQDVATRLDRPQSFVSKYESGERRLDVVEFLDVCQVLGISPKSILDAIGE